MARVQANSIPCLYFAEKDPIGPELRILHAKDHFVTTYQVQLRAALAALL